MPKSKEILNRIFFRLLDFGDRLLRGLTGAKSLTGGLIEQSESLISFCVFCLILRIHVSLGESGLGRLVVPMEGYRGNR